MDGDCIESAKPFCLWKPIVYENGVQAFHIGQADELVNGGIITNVSLEIGIGVPPFSRRHAEQGDIKKVGLIGIDKGNLFLRHFGRNEILLDGIGVNAIVHFREFPFGSPANEFLLFFLRRWNSLIRYTLNSGLIHMANSKAMSL